MTKLKLSGNMVTIPINQDRELGRRYIVEKYNRRQNSWCRAMIGNDAQLTGTGEEALAEFLKLITPKTCGHYRLVMLIDTMQSTSFTLLCEVKKEVVVCPE